MNALLPDSASLDAAVNTLAAVGAPLSWIIALTVAAAFAACWIAPAARWRRPALWSAFGALAAGEAALVWFHLRLYQLAVVVDPSTGVPTGHIAVSPWVESEKLYVWALMLVVMLLVARRHTVELLPLGSAALLALVALAIVWGRPFAAPVPDFLSQYRGYLDAMAAGGQAALGAFQGMEGTRQGYYNAWYMWVHPPLLFLS